MRAIEHSRHGMPPWRRYVWGNLLESCGVIGGAAAVTAWHGAPVAGLIAIPCAAVLLTGLFSFAWLASVLCRQYGGNAGRRLTRGG